MKIVFFSRLFYPHVGGVEKHVLEVGKRLVKKGHDVIVITENYQSLPSTAKIEGINIVRVDVGKDDWFKKIRIWQGLLKNIQLIRSSDIVHCHDIFFWYLPFRFIFPFKKVYTTFHGYEGNNIPNLRSIFMHKIGEKLSGGNICIGNFYKKWYGTKATLISFGAVDNNLIKQGERSELPTKDAMFLGRQEEETGFMEYLKAAKDLNLTLDVYGDGSKRKVAERYAKDNNLRVSFKGFVANATDYIKDYKYIFTSRYLGILEAMAVRRPVFAVYNNNIKKDYLEMTPFSSWISVSKDNFDLKQHIENPKINIDKAFGWVKTETWEKMTELYLKLWKN